MSKFKVGDEVVCIDDNGSHLDKGTIYIVKDVDYTEKSPVVELKNTYGYWGVSRFELLSEWASHQKPVSTENRLALLEIQVKMLQDWKKDALYLLGKTSHEGMIPTTLREEIDYFLVNNKLEGFDE